MKLAAAIILLAILFLLGTQIYKFWDKDAELQKEFSDFKTKLDRAKLDQSQFRADLDYYLNPANLEKELRARFNYRAPDEKLLIIVPRDDSSTPPSANQ